ncbi:MAG: flagellar FliJ family protein [Planctomycetota bacterium]|nr:flagellar FliJ family protein [Planctomycetota bacterium]
MPSFLFAYEALLTKRKAEERARQVALASLQRRREELLGQIRISQAELATARLEMRHTLHPNAGTAVAVVPGMLDVAAIRSQTVATLGLVAKAQEAVRLLAALQPSMEQARAAWLASRAKRRAVESLRERHHRAWINARNKRDELGLDELATLRFRASRLALDPAHVESGDRSSDDLENTSA